MVAPRLAPRDLALVLAVVALWGFSFVPIKVGLEEIPPFAFAALRFFLAAVPLVFFVPPPRMPAGLVIAYGLAIGVFQFGLLFLGIKLGMPAGLSSLVIQLQAFFTIGLGIAFLGDRLHTENVVGAIVAGIGVALLGLHHIALGADSSQVGLALVIVAAVAWAIGNVIAKHAARRYHADMLDLVVWSSLAPPLPLMAASYALEGGPAAWHAIASASLLTWSCAVFLAYLATIFGFGSWARMLHRYPTGLVAPFALLVPVSGLASGAVLLGESLAPLQLAGAGLVLAGLAVNVYGARLGARRAEASGE
ncbi:MAG TPA: EamA family transporter [Casimicrobiaceae bacterium]|nr:EamA family transporter [Casimicrobiaceae bacterium]